MCIPTRDASVLPVWVGNSTRKILERCWAPVRSVRRPSRQPGCSSSTRPQTAGFDCWPSVPTVRLSSGRGRGRLDRLACWLRNPQHRSTPGTSRPQGSERVDPRDHRCLRSFRMPFEQSRGRLRMEEPSSHRRRPLERDASVVFDGLAAGWAIGFRKRELQVAGGNCGARLPRNTA